MLLRKRDREREVREGITMRKVPVKHVMDRERKKERGVARERKRERERDRGRKRGEIEASNLRGSVR